MRKIPINVINILRNEAWTTIKKVYVNPDGFPFWKDSESIDFVFSHSCLPVHLAILNKVKELGLGPSPQVVIGLFEESHLSPKEYEIQHILTVERQEDPMLYYHAWIQLDQNKPDSIFDLTGHLYKNHFVEQNYLDAELAKEIGENGYTYHPLITEMAGIYEYHACLIIKVFSKQSTMVNNEQAIWYLTRFANHHNISFDMALATSGKKLLNFNIDRPKTLIDRLKEIVFIVFKN
ncbi:hypothetical protein [Vibrio cholerae]|uniref:hypothetical protein n=1 Tax=Vibrio cholerae TaxID=666 RepID=UPI00036EA1FD|nr:hypothetical protein [Vibrio cholerae]EGQ7978495.1 hypothetical protein [Vibrio cholerae]MBJ6888483.1 hypothetical protein [Vibrio cholerae]RNE84476.1 hypothetical protein EEJ38_17085 [Vibrio cholerae]HDV5443296.1 hypothetical protein [Vibrio cholerae]